ncbi:MAG: glycosyltransferase family 1 protein [Caldilineae bacterium]|nr:MAG: glycosyltransferase family 1 protein [Caldilineae bacterium]
MMLTDQDIVCFAANHWSDIWRNRHQIMTRLARHNRVLFVEPPPVLRHLQAVARNSSQPYRGPHLASPVDNLWVYRPPLYAPLAGRRPLADLTFYLRRRALRRALRQLRMRHPILWIFQYDLNEMIGHLDEKLVVYHAVDEYSAYYPSNPDQDREAWRAQVRRREADVIRHADLVFVTSPALYESKRALHPNIYLVPNGVDYELFSRPSAPGILPPDLADVPAPRLCYSGVINEKMDLALLLALARSHPHWHFVFVGPVALRNGLEQLRELQRLSNTHFLGRKPVEQLPNYMHASHVCLIPYRRIEWTRNISPLKLYEYLATGVPIVSTAIPAVQEFSQMVWVASTPEEFAQAIDQALAANTPERNRRQQELAREHTWDRRVETISAIVAEHLAAPRTPHPTDLRPGKPAKAK